MKKCNACIIDYSDDKNYCKKCGAPLTTIIVSKKDAQKIVFEEKLKLDPLNISLLSECAQFYIENNENKEAVSVLLRILVIEPKNEIAQKLIFKAYQKLYLYKEAYGIGIELLKISPDDLDLLENMAQIAHNSDDFNEELNCYSRICELQPKNIDILSKKASVLLILDETNKATELYCLMYLLGDRHFTTLIYKGIHLVFEENYKEAEDVFNFAMTSIDSNSDYSQKQVLFLYLAYCHYKLDKGLDLILETFSKIELSAVKADETLVKIACEISVRLFELIFDLTQTELPENNRVLETKTNILLKVELFSKQFKNSSYLYLSECWYFVAKTEHKVGLLKDALDSISNAVNYLPTEKKLIEKQVEIKNLIDSIYRKKKTKTIVGISFTFVLVIVLVLSVKFYNKNKELKLWQSAVNSNTIDAYNQYKNSFPKGDYVIVADSIIEEISWSEAFNNNTFDSYCSYLLKYKKGKYSIKADSISQEILWQNANKDKSTSSYKFYMEHFPTGKYSNDAKLYIEKYLIQDGRISGMKITCNYDDKTPPKIKYKDFSFKREIFEIEGGDTSPFYTIYEKGKEIMCYCPCWVWVYSSKFKTDKNIGIGSTIEEFIYAYPDCEINYESPGENLYSGFYLSIKNIQGNFCLSENDYLYVNDDYESKYNCNRNDFKKGAKVEKILLFPKEEQ
jgi:tetratricopeptide (TPR) repeat protein